MFGLNVDWTGWIVVDRRLELQNIEQQLPDMWKLIRHRELYAIETLTANKSIANTESCTRWSTTEGSISDEQNQIEIIKGLQAKSPGPNKLQS